MYFLPIGDKNLVVSHHIECCRNDVRLVTAAANNAMLHLPPKGRHFFRTSKFPN